MISSWTTLNAEISSGRLDDHFATLYGQDIEVQKRRYLRLLDRLSRDMERGARAIFVNAPGRTELGGNHTDHNHGCVLAAAVDLDCVAAVTPVENPEVTLISEYSPKPIRVDLGDLEPHPEEQGKPEALVRGMAAAFFRRTGSCRGFYGQLHATCLPGTGLSSSAAFSVLVGASFNLLFEGNRFSAETLAVMAKEAENEFFGKPCGLMDQMASGVGRTIFIDFYEPEVPIIEKIDHTLEGTGYRLVIIETGGSHVELTAEYAAIPTEMKAASEVLGQPFARGVTFEKLLGSIVEIRKRAGDRAVLRLLHYIEENERAQRMAKLLHRGRFSEYLQCVEESGASSCCLLQNCASTTNSREQGILLAIAMSRRICQQVVCRVHGGGFAGTVQAYVPDKEFDNYRSSMEQIFGTGSVIPVQIGRPGVCGLNDRGLILPQVN